jgi:hypothetical protein
MNFQEHTCETLLLRGRHPSIRLFETKRGVSLPAAAAAAVLLCVNVLLL